MGLRFCISNKLPNDANAAHVLSNKNLNKRLMFSQIYVSIFQGIKYIADSKVNLPLLEAKLLFKSYNNHYTH